MLPVAEGESGLRAAEHQPHLAADPDPAGQEGEGPGVRAGRGEGRAAAERVHHAGRNLAAILIEHLLDDIVRRLQLLGQLTLKQC